MASRATPTLDLNNKEEADCWLMAFEAKMKIKEAEDKDGNEKTHPDYQITNYFISLCGQDSLKKLCAIVSPKQLPDMKFSDIKKEIQMLIHPRDRLLVAERIKFLAIEQAHEESEVNFLTD